MTVQSALAIVGLANQAAKGAATAEPEFVFGLNSGGPFRVEVDQSPEERTLDAARIAPDANRLSVVPGASFTTRGFPGSIGLLLLGALGGIATTGVGPFEHVITPATDVPYLTGWGRLGGGDLERFRDGKVDELTLSWEEAGPLSVEATLIGTVMDFPASITPVNDDSQAGYFRAAGGEFKMDAGSDTPVAAPIKGGNIGIANGAAPVILSSSVVPDDVSVARQEISIGLTLVIEDLAEWRKTITGTGAGTTVSQVVVEGSIEYTFNLGTNSLVLAAGRVPLMGDFPEADPSGGPVELELEGTAILPIGTPAFTATLTNDITSY